MRASARLVRLDVDGGLGAERARKLQSRAFRRADGDDAAGAHLLRRGDGENADRPGALDDDGVVPLEAAGLHGAIEGTDAARQRLRQRAQQQPHVVGQLVDLGAGQLAQVDIDVLGPAAPQVRRLVEAQIAAVVDGGEALVGRLGIVLAPVAEAARHQRRQHHLGADLQRLAHEVGVELRADLDDDAGQLVPQRERPRQRLGPMPLEDVLVGAAHAAGADLDQRALGRHLRPRHLAHDGLGAGPVVGGDADLGSISLHSPACSRAGVIGRISCRATGDACRHVRLTSACQA